MDSEIAKALAASARRGEVNPMMLDVMDFKGVPPIQPTPPQPKDLRRGK